MYAHLHFKRLVPLGVKPLLDYLSCEDVPFLQPLPFLHPLRQVLGQALCQVLGHDSKSTVRVTGTWRGGNTTQVGSIPVAATIEVASTSLTKYICTVHVAAVCVPIAPRTGPQQEYPH